MISPTGMGIRTWDDFGSGYFGVGRGDHLHDGVDFICKPGQTVVAPFTGRIVRLAYPYADKTYGGLVLDDGRLCVKMFYMEPISEFIGTWVDAGDPIGRAQDISKKHGAGMTPHIHLEIAGCDPLFFLDDP